MVCCIEMAQPGQQKTVFRAFELLVLWIQVVLFRFRSRFDMFCFVFFKSCSDLLQLLSFLVLLVGFLSSFDEGERFKMIQIQVLRIKTQQKNAGL